MAKLTVGDPAPDFTATTDQGETLSLSSLKGKKIVLYFYPKDNTPGCTTQACSFRDVYETIEKQDAVVLGVSPDSVASHQKFKAKFSLPFPLLVDEAHEMARAYGAWGEKSMYGKKYEGVIRSHFVIGPDGRIVDAQYNVSPKDSSSKALAALGADA